MHSYPYATPISKSSKLFQQNAIIAPTSVNAQDHVSPLSSNELSYDPPDSRVPSINIIQSEDILHRQQQEEHLSTLSIHP